MKFVVQGAENSGGWWQAILAGNDWESYNLEPYMQNGSLTFYAKGERGSETFMVGLNDTVPGRNPLNVNTSTVFVGPLSTEWQQVTIPPSSFTSPETGRFNPAQMSTLRLSSANTNPHTFWIADVRFSSPDSEIVYPAVKVNQVGYRPDGLKEAFVTGFPNQMVLEDGDPFTITSTVNGSVVFEGDLDLVSLLDEIASGEKVLMADFTSLEQPGSYILTAGAGASDQSVPFEISEDVFDSLLIDATRYMYLQRSGMPLDPQYAGQFARPTGHPQDQQAQFRSGAFGPRDVSGGWYDAGDYGKYVNAGATTISDLLWAFELFPEQFPDNHLNIPESGNGVPDLIDEMRWELDWMLKMQDPESGGFYHMVQPTESTTPDTQEGPRYIEDAVDGLSNVRPSAGTASAVAAMAHASLVFEAIDPDYAATLRTAAENGYAYLRANPELVQPVDGAYADWDDSDNRFWAATAMYRLTGDESYHNDIRATYQDVRTTFRSTNDNGYGVQDMGMVAWLAYIYSDNQDPAVRAFFEEEFGAWSAHMTRRWENSTWNHTLLDEDYYWGSNYVALTTPLVMYTAQRGMGQPTTATEQHRSNRYSIQPAH